jgi:hypothetical protein
MTKTQKGVLGFFGGLFAFLGIRALVKGKEEPPPPPPPDLATLWGKVQDGQTKNPVEGIQTTCNGYTAMTDMDGRFEILDITPGVYTVRFTDPLGRYEPLEI